MLRGIFKIALRLREMLNFQYFNFETNLLKSENFFRKSAAPFFSLKY